ncbi:MAG: hypothetical protein KGL39_45240, partial [Patescibacteria group bacterium]|nr:hypothetical protein [Patescibacteria group bacterium]
MNRAAKLTCALLLLVGVASAATTIRDTLKYPNGNPFEGRISISWPAFTASGKTIIGGKLAVDVKGGALNIQLEANDTASPTGTSYTVQYALNGTPYTEYWIVPTSATPVTVAAIRTSAVPTPNLQVSLGQLTQGGATTGQCLAWTGAGWQPVNCSAGGSNATSIQGRTVSGAAPSAGMVLAWNATTGQWEPQISTGGVTSVFGRTGAVTPQTGDYSASQVTNAVDNTGSYVNPSWISSLSWSKISGVPSFEPPISAGTTAQFWRGDKTWQALTSDAVAEGTTNLYFTQARARASLSAAAPLSFNSGTGAFSLPPATGTQDGYLKASDWAIFNAKQSAITTGATAQYLRGDLSLATFPTTWAWGALTGVPSTFAPPAPTVSTLGGVNSHAAATHQFLTGIGIDGSVSAAQPSAADVSGLAAVASSGSASDLGSGTLPAARLPWPGATTLGGVQAKDCSSTGAVQKINADGTITCGSAGGGGTTRTWAFVWPGTVQAGAAGFAVNLPPTNSPVLTSYGTTMPRAVLQWPTAQSVQYGWWILPLPAGYVANSAITYRLESMSADATNAAQVYLGIACSSTLTQDPTIVEATAAAITGAASSARTVTTGTLTPNSG